MVGALLRRWRAAREQRASQRRAIPDGLWQATLESLPFLRRWPEADRAELRRLSSLFLDEKSFNGAGGLEVTDAMAVSIAAQACLPVLRFGLDAYRGFNTLIVHPSEVLAPRQVLDEHGVMHEYDEPLVGEVNHLGPIMLSWDDVSRAGEASDQVFNVVIHEFAHVLDMGNGAVDGVPPMPDARALKAWAGVLELEYERFCRRVDDGDATVLDPYGASDPAEFFAVATEAFFVQPVAMRDELPWFYPLLARYFAQDPAGLT